MLTYTYDQQLLFIRETANGADMEFEIELLGDARLDAELKDIQREFEADEVLTDVLFYVYPHRKYQVIVRSDYYDDFIFALMKHRLLLSVAWN